MDKRSTLEAVYAESLVFESNFGPGTGAETVLATDPSRDVVKPAQWIPAWSAAALACENVGTSDPTTEPVTH